MNSNLEETQQMYPDLLDSLGYSTSLNFVSKNTPEEDIRPERRVTWQEAKDRLGIDAIYFVANAPVIYFKRFDVYNEQIPKLHRNVWSQSKVPLLFVILPKEIRIYSGYEEPKQGNGEPSRLEEKLGSTRKSDSIWERLHIFTQVAIESGDFWRKYSEEKYFKRTRRADWRLMANLSYVRDELIQNISQQVATFHHLDIKQHEREIKEISSKYANNLIGRSIFALYLQDRNILQTENGGNFFTARYGSKFTRFTDILISYKDTYTFFEFLQERFNGDIFPVDEDEKNIIREEHLQKLRELFTTDHDKQQYLFFWAYNFEFVPIELISAIYEEFLRIKKDKKSKQVEIFEKQTRRESNDGAYYTPPRLVDFVLDQVLPEGDTSYDLKILDPACGSGVFLVGAYRRLVERWSRVHRRRPLFTDLVRILQSSLFGVDIKGEALSVASFSLCLTLADYLDADTIWTNVRFPSLVKDGNLVEADFFDKKIRTTERDFDLVVGNPPWESQLTLHAKAYIAERGYNVGDEQIAQAFLWLVPELCTVQGRVALLCSSKNLLFNRSTTNTAFRKEFFQKFAVTQVFDFSALRNYLFVNAVAPTAAIFYSPQPPDPSATIFYGAPKLTPLTRRFASLVIEADDLKHLPIQQVWESINSMPAEKPEKDDVDDVAQQQLFSETTIEQDAGEKHFINIWKTALWGTSYDYILLQRLNRYPALGQVIREKKWVSKVGINVEGPNKNSYKTASWLDDKPYLKTEKFARYNVHMHELESLPAGRKYYRRGIEKQFKAPFVLFKRTQVHREIAAAYFAEDCAYSETFSCIAGPLEDETLLKAITALLNSEIAKYYYFFTTASWGVEREEIKIGEMKLLPVPFLVSSKDTMTTIAHLVDKLSQNPAMPYDEAQDIEKQINNFIYYHCFHLSEQQVQHIRETLAYTIDFFHKPDEYFKFKSPVTLEMKKSYAQYYMQSLNFYLRMVNRKLTGTVYRQEKDLLLAIKFSLHELNEELAAIQEELPDDMMRSTLLKLDKLSIEHIGGGTYQRRNFQIYDGEEKEILYKIKPAEPRYWTIGAALSDAEETLTELM